MSKLEIVQQKNWRGLTTPDHLGWLGMSQPEIINSTIQNLFELDYGSNNIVSLMNKFPVYELNQDGEYRWMVYGATERAISLVKATSDSAGSTVVTSTDTFGLNKQPFYLWFGEDYFPGEPGILAGSNPEYYQYQVKGEPIKLGELVGYKVVLHTGDMTAYAPYADLSGGVQFTYMYGLVEQTLSSKGTDVFHSSPFMLENTTSYIRKEYLAPGSMINQGKNQPLAFAFKAGDELKMRWIDKLSYDFRVQCMWDKAKLLLYGKSTKGKDGNYNSTGISGNTIRAGFGLYEQMEMGNILTYNSFDLDLLFEFIMDFSVGKMTQDSREWLLTCGEYGALDFSRAALARFAGLPWFRTDYNAKAIKADGSIDGRDGQVFTWEFANGVKIKVMIDSSKDTLPNTKKHPRGGLYSSRIFDVFDIGTTNGQPNIQIVKVKDTPEIFTYIAGIRTPFTPSGKMDSNSPVQVNSEIDGYKVIWACPAIGIKVNNPLRVARIIPSDYLI